MSLTYTEKRCDCQLPCTRKVFTIQSWRSDAKNKHEVENGLDNGFAFFQVFLMQKLTEFLWTCIVKISIGNRVPKNFDIFGYKCAT